MLPWAEVKIDTKALPALIDAVRKHEGDNPACVMSTYWGERRGPQMLSQLANNHSLPVGFVGNGWPEQWRSQEWAVEQDRHDLHKLFTPNDLHTRDAGDAIYQAGHLFDLYGFSRFRVVDLGSGYGRLGFLLIQKGAHYIGVDYTPIGLLTAPQFLKQVTDKQIGDWSTDWASFDGASLPAWRVDEIPTKSVDAFVSVHSFQEMGRSTVDFYIDWVKSRAADQAVLYSVNLDEPDYVPDSWELIFERPYPINRDGDFMERMWQV